MRERAEADGLRRRCGRAADRAIARRRCRTPPGHSLFLSPPVGSPTGCRRDLREARRRRASVTQRRARRLPDMPARRAPASNAANKRDSCAAGRRGCARLSCPALANAMRANSRARPPGSASGQPAGGHCAADRPLARIRSAMRCPHGVVPRTRATNLGRFAHLSPRSLILQFLRKRYIQWSADAS